MSKPRKVQQRQPYCLTALVAANRRYQTVKTKARRQGRKHGINGTERRTQSLNKWHEDGVQNARTTASNEDKHGIARSSETEDEFTQNNFTFFVFVFVHNSQQMGLGHWAILVMHGLSLYCQYRSFPVTVIGMYS